MDPHTQLQDLIDVASRLSITVESGFLGHEEFPARGGFCRLRGQGMIFLDKKQSPEQQVRVLIDILKQFDLDDVFVPPWIRERLEPRIPESYEP